VKAKIKCGIGRISNEFMRALLHWHHEAPKAVSCWNC